MKIAIGLLLTIILLNSSIAHAWVAPFMRFLTNSASHSFNLGSKFITTQNSLESMIERRLGNEYFRYENGEFYHDSALVIYDQSIVDKGNELRKNAWAIADKARKIKNTNLNYDALKVYKEALKVDANNWQIWHGYGWSLAEVGQYQKASNAFTIAIYLGGDSESWRHLGWNYQRQGHLERAKYFYIKALQVEPTNERAHAALKGVEVAIYAKNKKTSVSSKNTNKQKQNSMYTIQAGVFKKGSNALSLKRRIITKHNIYINNQVDANKYYVQVGKFSDKNVAVRQQKKLKHDNPSLDFFVK